MRRPPPALLAILALAIACQLTAARAQSRLHTFDGGAAGDALGRSVAGAGDVDGDGTPDVILGAPENDTNGAECGMAVVRSGATGAVLWTFLGAAANYRLGDSVAGAGDVNADGYADLVVGAIGDSSVGSGAARVYSGFDGSELWAFHGAQVLGFFGFCVDGAGDFDADGYDDVIVAGPALIGPGQGRVFSGRDGSVLLQFLTQGFGQLVAGAGDVDGDGFADIVYGSPLDGTGGANAGRVTVVSGRTRVPLFTFFGAPGDELGVAVAGAGDVDADGFDDVIVGSRQLLNAGPGRATVFSGFDGSTLGTFVGSTVGEDFGTAVAGAGDVDGDGRDDVIVGSARADGVGVDAGSAEIYSVLSNIVLLALAGEAAFDEFGIAVAGAGDLDGDGLADVVVGAYRDDHGGLDAGRAVVEAAGFTGTPSRERTYGVACPGTAGVPRIGHIGRARLGTTLTLLLRGALPNVPAILLIGDPAMVALDPLGMTGCTRYADLAGLSWFTFTDADGLARLPLALPPAPNFLVGLRLDCQWATGDPGRNPAGLVSSDALAATFH